MQKLMDTHVEIAPTVPHDQGAPAVNGPAILGASVHKKFTYHFPVRGAAPVEYSVDGELPAGIVLDSRNGRLSGVAKKEGDYRFLLKASNVHGAAEKAIRLRITQNSICLTPLLGWTSWNAYMDGVNQELVLKNAQALVQTGLSARGYSYVNVDSCWQGDLDKDTLALNANWRFPDMQGMVADIHKLGLKAGIYSTPMVIAWGSTKSEVFRGSTGFPLDPASFHAYFGGCGSVPFEDAHARQWAKWGFDYLKYDWPECDVAHTRTMSDALRNTDRDFVFSLTTGCKIEHIEEYKKYAHMYRSNVDTADRWERVKENGFQADKWAAHIAPGSWFDMDMLAVGEMEIERNQENPYYRPYFTPSRKNRLTRDELITHVSIWAIFPSPIQISCDLTTLDEFSLSLLSNEEILAINQDELGEGAVCIKHELERLASGYIQREIKIYRKNLACGSYALGFFNLSDLQQSVNFKLPKRSAIRDAWALRDLGREERVEMILPPHGCRVLVINGKH